MNWQQIRDQHPNQWVVVEALNATTRGAERVIDELVLINVFDNSKSAWREYAALHHADKWREYYVLHTDRPALNIGVIDSFGRVLSN